MQFQANILNVDIIIPKVAETTALGACFAAGLAVGYWKSLDDIQAKWQVNKTQRQMKGCMQISWRNGSGRNRSQNQGLAQGDREELELGRRISLFVQQTSCKQPSYCTCGHYPSTHLELLGNLVKLSLTFTGELATTTSKLQEEAIPILSFLDKTHLLKVVNAVTNDVTVGLDHK